MRELNLSTKYQVKKNISDILFDDRINFPNLFRNRIELPPLFKKRHFMLATLNNCLAIFASNRASCFMCDNDTQRHANKGAQQIAVHRLQFGYGLGSSPTLKQFQWWIIGGGVNLKVRRLTGT